MAVILDSDTVIGFLDADDVLHSAAAARLTELLKLGEPVFASVVTFAEVLTGVKLGHHPEEDVRGFFSEVIAEILPVDESVAEQAAEIRAALRSLKMPDALILASAEIDDEVELVLCGDAEATRLSGLMTKVELLAP